MFCPECNSSDVTIKATDCICNSCGKKFKAPLGVYSEVIEGKNLGYSPLSWRTEELTKHHNEFVTKYRADMNKARIKALQFDWREKGTHIPLVLMFVFAGMALVASVSYSSYLVTPFTYLSILFGFIYFIVKVFKIGKK